MSLRGAFSKAGRPVRGPLQKFCQEMQWVLGEDHDENKQQVSIRRESQQNPVINGWV